MLLRHGTGLFIVLLSFCFQGSYDCLFQDKYPAGQIIDTVKCRSDNNFSYSLYLPSSYSGDLKWPVILVFDPAARGRLAVNNFIPAAEKYGYIIVCSNNSRNRISWDVISSSINCMFEDVGRKFRIDKSRVYTSGFSGGSRVASAVALQNNIISGVIACGAGLPDGSATVRKLPFNYLGLVGDKDMNYNEMCDLEQQLEQSGSNSELRIFEGGHKWPESDQLTEAVEWLELQAMREGKRRIDNEFISSQFRKYRQNTEENLKTGRLVEAARLYKYMLKNFPENENIEEIRKGLDNLEHSKDYITVLKQWKRNRSREREKSEILVTALAEQVKSGIITDSLMTWMSGQIRMLRKNEADKDPDTRAMSSRIIMLLNMYCYETGLSCFNLKKFNAASIYFSVQLMIEPENIMVLMLHAKSCALCDNADQSISSIRKAVRLGYNDRVALEKEPAFAGLRNEPAFRKILGDLQ